MGDHEFCHIENVFPNLFMDSCAKNLLNDGFNKFDFALIYKFVENDMPICMNKETYELLFQDRKYV